jgi:hypothetical protein
MLNADQQLAVAVIDCLTSLDDTTLNRVRLGRRSGTVKIPGRQIVELVRALETAHPGVLDRTLKLVGREP